MSVAHVTYATASTSGFRSGNVHGVYEQVHYFCSFLSSRAYLEGNYTGTTGIESDHVVLTFKASERSLAHEIMMALQTSAVDVMRGAWRPHLAVSFRKEPFHK